MMEWWNDIRMLCARYLIASEMVDRTGPVEAAVRAAGYNEEEYDEHEDEIEDDEDGDLVAPVHIQDEHYLSGDEEDHHQSHGVNAPPDYSRPQSFAEKAHPVEPTQMKTVVRDCFLQGILHSHIVHSD